VKKLVILLASLFLYVTVLSQTVTIRLEGTANNSNSANMRDYIIDVDGRQYYSSDASITGSAGIKQIVITDLARGTHKITVYEANSNNSAGDLVYSNNFQLRAGYDMIVSIRRNGNVAFTEKKIKETTGNTSASTPMTDANFDKLVQSVKSKWSQSSRISAIKTAFANKSYYFSTNQVGELLLLVNTESRRLELAKLAYPRVTDQQNFTDVADLFNTQANRDNIMAFIEEKNPDIIAGTGVKPLTNQQFNQLLRKVRNQYDQTGKYAVLRDAFSLTTNYFTTAQLRQLISQVTAEGDRLSLAKLAYARVTDEANFSSLYNLFRTQAARDELDSYARSGGSLTSSGQYSSRIAMSDADFSKLHMKARLHFRQSSTVSDVKEALSNKNNYFTIAQTRSLLSLISDESDRLSLAKLAYHRAADPTVFNQLYDMFTSQSSVDDLTNYIRNNPY